jgi:hypothetical protein
MNDTVKRAIAALRTSQTMHAGPRREVDEIIAEMEGWDLDAETKRADRAETMTTHLNGHLAEAIHVLRRVVDGEDEAVAAQVCLDGIEAGEALTTASLLARAEKASAEVTRLESLVSEEARLIQERDAYVDAAVTIYEKFRDSGTMGVVMQPDGDAPRLAVDVCAYVNAAAKLAAGLDVVSLQTLHRVEAERDAQTQRCEQMKADIDAVNAVARKVAPHFEYGLAELIENMNALRALSWDSERRAIKERDAAKAEVSTLRNALADVEADRNVVSAMTYAQRTKERDDARSWASESVAKVILVEAERDEAKARADAAEAMVMEMREALETLARRHYSHHDATVLKPLALTEPIAGKWVRREEMMRVLRETMESAKANMQDAISRATEAEAQRDQIGWQYDAAQAELVRLTKGVADTRRFMLSQWRPPAEAVLHLVEEIIAGGTHVPGDALAPVLATPEAWSPPGYGIPMVVAEVVEVRGAPFDEAGTVNPDKAKP